MCVCECFERPNMGVSCQTDRLIHIDNEKVFSPSYFVANGCFGFVIGKRMTEPPHHASNMTHRSMETVHSLAIVLPCFVHGIFSASMYRRHQNMKKILIKYFLLRHTIHTVHRWIGERVCLHVCIRNNKIMNELRSRVR